MSLMGWKGGIKDEKCPATEPEAIHQDVRGSLKAARNPHLGGKKKRQIGHKQREEWKETKKVMSLDSGAKIVPRLRVSRLEDRVS